MITTDLKLLLDQCSKDPHNHTLKLIAADCAEIDNNLISLGWFLRWSHETRLAPLFTGSRCYGTPRPESDWDWVIKIQQYPQKVLVSHADEVTEKEKDQYPDGGYEGSNRLDRALRFGPVNLICCSSTMQYQAWCNGTRYLTEQAPVTRKKAIETFQRMWEHEVAIRDAELAMQMT